MKPREDAHKKELKDAEAKVKEEKERSDRDMKEKKEVIFINSGWKGRSRTVK
jgi:hypothetical protein